MGSTDLQKPQHGSNLRVWAALFSCSMVTTACSNLDDRPACYNGTCFEIDPTLASTIPPDVLSLSSGLAVGVLVDDTGTRVIYMENHIAFAPASSSALDAVLAKYRATERPGIPSFAPKSFLFSLDQSSVPEVRKQIQLTTDSLPLEMLPRLLHQSGYRGTVWFNSNSAAVTAGVYLRARLEDTRKGRFEALIINIATPDASEDEPGLHSQAVRMPESCNGKTKNGESTNDLSLPVRPYDASIGNPRCACVQEAADGSGLTFDPRIDAKNEVASGCRRGIPKEAAPALVLEQATVFDAREDSCEPIDISIAGWVPVHIDGGHTGNLHLWVVPPSIMPFSVKSSSFDGSLPPGGLDTYLPGPARSTDAGQCEWLAYRPEELSAAPHRLDYAHFPLWNWGNEDRVYLFVWEGDECKCVPSWAPFFCSCNPDDPLALFEVRRDTPGLANGVTFSDELIKDAPWLSGPSFHDIDLNLRFVDECREGDFESCNGHDDNCNGSVDEDTRNACGRCGPLPPEVCDYVDNNCNGQIDEGIPKNACGSCGATPQELCDGIDNNCNGQVDEVFPEQNMPCGNQTGECIPGKVECINGTLVCSGAVGPTVELCGDSVDNDCDGSTDEGFVCCGSISCGTSIGVCNTGVRTCTPQGWSQCNGPNYIGPTAELCDGLDNNCNGTVDEDAGCGCMSGESRPCGVAVGICTKGTQFCTNGSWGACVGAVGPSDETCNGVDDDCDGAVDQGLASRICWTSCGQGVQQCSNGSWSPCSAKQPAGSETLCDGLDDDCDGSIDEDDASGDGMPLRQACYDGPISTRNVGICSDGARYCSNGTYLNQPCIGQTLPASTEPCDGLDNNCDGTADEGTEFLSDPANCGGCGIQCQTLNAVSNICQTGICSPVCLGGWFDTDANGSNGCECGPVSSANVLASPNMWPDDTVATFKVGTNLITMWSDLATDCSGGPYVYAVGYSQTGVVTVGKKRIQPPITSGGPFRFGAFPHPGGFIWIESQPNPNCAVGTKLLQIHQYDANLNFMGTSTAGDCTTSFGDDASAAWDGTQFLVVSGGSAFFWAPSGVITSPYLSHPPQAFHHRLGGFSGSHFYFIGLTLSNNSAVFRFGSNGVYDKALPIVGNLNLNTTAKGYLEFEWLDSRYAVAGHYGFIGDWHSEVQFYDPDGVQLAVTDLDPSGTADPTIPKLAWNGQTLAVVWNERQAGVNPVRMLSINPTSPSSAAASTLLSPGFRPSILDTQLGFAISYFQQIQGCSCCNNTNSLNLVTIPCN